MPKNQLFYVAQKAFVRKGDKLLLLVDPRYGLDLPGGRIQEGETNQKVSMDREVEEELGIKIKIGRPMTTWTWQLRDEENPVYLVGFGCEFISGEIRLSEDHSEYYWVTKDSVKYKELIEKYREENPEICSAIETYYAIVD